MNTTLMKLKEGFSEKIAQLEEARIQLKKEFIGIDDPIDEIIENVRSWYTLAEIQDKPNIINLWGLTGVGKTSLLLRLSELLDVREKTFRIDLGEKKGKYALKASLDEISDISNDEPLIIILDEIQHARTLKGTIIKEEVENDANRIIWELIDSGKIASNLWGGAVIQLFEYIKTLSSVIHSGVVIRNGKVIDGINLFRREMKEFFHDDCEYVKEKEGEYYIAVPSTLYRIIFDFCPKRYGLKFVYDLEQYLKKLDQDETVVFLNQALKSAQRPRIQHFNKALIFVVGNLDEAYRFNGNMSADISADDFYELSKEINVPIVKSALRERFRDEQIARLGNTHIIYPALNKKAYREIIQLNLNSYFQTLQKRYGIEWTYDESLVDKIYSEGVYPTQGARPVFTTIEQVVKSKTSVIFQSVLEQPEEVDEISLSIQDGCLYSLFWKNKMYIDKAQFSVPSKLDALRLPKNDESQAITAIHEAGHAVLIAHLLHQAPQVITATSTDGNSEGFVFSRTKNKFFPKHELIKQAAIKLGGLMAEQIIFGEEYKTLGATSDIEKMYVLINAAFKEAGMGKKTYRYAASNLDESIALHHVEDVENEITEVIDAAKELAEQTLKSERRMLLELAQVLQNKSKVEQKEFIELYSKYGAKKIDFTEESTYYRDTINKALEALESMESIATHRAIVLNKSQQKENVLTNNLKHWRNE